MSKKIAIILSGCGVKDGSEIHEAVVTLLAIVKSGASPLFYAPNINQIQVTNHLTDDSSKESRNVLVESARIARGEIKDLKELRVSDADALVFPGGFGAALNLCNFAQKGADCCVHPEVARVIHEYYKAGKPIGALCIAPVLLAKVLGQYGVELTIGQDVSTAKTIEKTGARHVQKNVGDVCVDQKNKIVTTPAYMLAHNIAEVDAGVSKLIQAIQNLMG